MGRVETSDVEPRQGACHALKAPDFGWETVGEVARIARSSPELVRRYDRQGLISSARDVYGRRKFPPGTGELVKALKAERLVRCGQVPTA
jgi:hypothetical protein